MIALTTFLQATGQWWKGPSAAILLFLFGYLVTLVATSVDGAGTNKSVLMLSASAWISAALILIGSVLALLLRSHANAGKLAMWVFGVGFVLIYLSTMFI